MPGPACRVRDFAHFGRISLRYSICFTLSASSASWLALSHVRRRFAPPYTTVYGGRVSFVPESESVGTVSSAAMGVESIAERSSLSLGMTVQPAEMVQKSVMVMLGETSERGWKVFKLPIEGEWMSELQLCYQEDEKLRTISTHGIQP
jgi:hypothetical protein